MRAAIVGLVTIIALLSSVMAQSRKILVLPLDGDASADQRAKLNDSIAKIAKEKSGGSVTVGDTTFTEAAAAVGCDASQPSCAETVRSTLQVDELVYGNAKTADGQTTVIVTRVSAGTAPTSKISVIGETDGGEAATSELGSMFDSAAGSDAGSGSGTGSAGERQPVEGRSFFDTRERKLGVAFGAGGAIAVLVGLAFWNSASNRQDEIDVAPTRTLADIQAVKQLEDEAASKALWGNIFFFTGLAAVAVGGYFLWKDHKNRSATVAPAPVENGTGMTLVLGGRW